MKPLVNLYAALVGLTSLLLMSPSHAVDRCNTKFEFENRFDRPIIVSQLFIRGNQGNQLENIQNKKINPYTRHTTRKNRLQKLDDRHEGDFYVWARFESASPETGNSTWVMGTPYEVWNVNGIYASAPGTMNYWAGRVVGVRKKTTCRDNGTIKFVIGPINDTPQNRTRLGQVIRQPSKQTLLQGNWLDAYFKD